MSELKSELENIDLNQHQSPQEINERIAKILAANDYSVVLHDYDRPWGGFNQLANDNADRFVEEFFPDLSPEDARLGDANSELSPKILTVAPGQRLSWQFHNRRAERWAFITPGGYHKSTTDDQGELQIAQPGEVVQFEQAERHRLVGAIGHFTLVAEIWQHTKQGELSDEDDIVRLDDDYKR